MAKKRKKPQRPKPRPAKESRPEKRDAATASSWRRPWVLLGLAATVVGVAALLLGDHFSRNKNSAPATGDKDASHAGAERSEPAEPPVIAPQSAIQLPSRPVARGATQDSIDQLAAKVDAQQDDWQTEVLSEAALARLAVVQSLIERPQPIAAAEVAPLLAELFACGPLCPDEPAQVFHDGRLTVRRVSEDDLSSDTPLTGAAGFQTALNQLVRALGAQDHGEQDTKDKQGERHAKFKLYRIAREPNHFSTKVRYEASMLGKEMGRQQTALWDCQWSYPEGDQAPPKLQRIALESYEESDVRAPRGRLFVDCTASALAANDSYQQQMLPGIDHWLAHIPTEFIGRFGHNGLAVGDVNGDGLDDLYVCDSGGLPNRLYVHQADGTVRDASAEAGVDFLDDSTGALLIDLDNDGNQDLVVSAAAGVQIAENDGQGRFTLRESPAINTDALSISAADYDADGDLDLYLCGYNVRQREPTDRGLPFPWPYFDANNGERNVLLRNEGELRFVDATAEVGLDENNSRFSMAASWEDIDNDGDQDLYVANDFGRNNLYLNENGRFRDIAGEAGVEDHASGMSVSWGDYNRDGRMDLYVGNMFSAAGNRVTYQDRFSEGRADEAVTHLRRMARGNTLFANASEPGDPMFRDVSELEAVEMGRWAWGSRFADLTNDGWPDLIVANGYISSANEDDL